VTLTRTEMVMDINRLQKDQNLPDAHLTHLPRPSVCQKPHISRAQQQLEWNRPLEVIFPQGKQHVQKPSGLSSLQPVLCWGP
jgi:hypothetical protein